jgi:hypothetical protein
MKAKPPERTELRARARLIGRVGGPLFELRGVEHRESGWALLGLLLALAILSMVMVSAIVPNVKVQVQRDKETEMLYRGEQVARAIARYNNGGNVGNGLQLRQRPPYGFLTDFKKLREGIKVGINDLKLVRTSAMIDPMLSREWEPVRARDPRIMKVLEAWSSQSGVALSSLTEYLLIAGPPPKVPKPKPSDGFETEGEGQQTPGTTPPGRTPPKPPNKNPDSDDDDDDDDDDEDGGDGFLTPPDPLKHLFDTSSPGSSNAPIVGVAPREKGKAVRPLYGSLDNYEDWVFLYFPVFATFQGGGGLAPNPSGVVPPTDPSGAKPPTRR